MLRYFESYEYIVALEREDRRTQVLSRTRDELSACLVLIMWGILGPSEVRKLPARKFFLWSWTPSPTWKIVLEEIIGIFQTLESKILSQFLLWLFEPNPLIRVHENFFVWRISGTFVMVLYIECNISTDLCLVIGVGRTLRRARREVLVQALLVT